MVFQLNYIIIFKVSWFKTYSDFWVTAKGNVSSWNTQFAAPAMLPSLHCIVVLVHSLYFYTSATFMMPQATVNFFYHSACIFSSNWAQQMPAITISGCLTNLSIYKVLMCQTGNEELIHHSALYSTSQSCHRQALSIHLLLFYDKHSSSTPCSLYMHTKELFIYLPLLQNNTGIVVVWCLMNMRWRWGCFCI